MEIYLDNSATTKVYTTAMDEMRKNMLEVYGNPSSLHLLGKKAEDCLEDARSSIAKYIFAQKNEIYFTSGGTESNNISLIGYANANKRNGNKLITSAIEHPSVLEVYNYLGSIGFDVCYIDCISDGTIDMDMLKKEIDENTILVSIMYVNNETGAIMPIEEISKLVDHKKCMLHVDAVQAYGKIPINVNKQKIDMLSISSHKIHGPMGVGAVYIKNGVKVSPILFGGNQENKIRSGTQNLPGIHGFKTASDIKFKNMSEDKEKISKLKETLTNLLTDGLDDIMINSHVSSIYNILNISFLGVKSEVLLHVLESNGIYVSTGSACSSKKKGLSHVLKAMGLKDNEIDSALRFSFSHENTMEDIIYVAEVLKREVPTLRKIMR